MITIRYTIYNFEVKLEYLDEYKPYLVPNYYCMNFKVLSNNIFNAKKVLEEYLSNPKQTGLKYKTFLNIQPIESELIIVDSNFNIV